MSNAKISTVSAVSAVEVSPSLGKTITQLDELLHKEFGQDCAFTVMGKGQIVAASNMQNGIVVASYDRLSPQGPRVHKGCLTLIESKPDSAGHSYAAFRFFDYLSGKKAVATVSCGGNVYPILRYWSVQDDWDRSIIFNKVEMGIRAFNNETKNWPYAGCNSEDLAAWLKKELAK